MFGIGTTEILVILLVALIVIGPSKLPEIAKTLGKAFSEFKRVTSDVKKTIDKEIEKIEAEEMIKKYSEQKPLKGEDNAGRTNRDKE